MSAREEAVVRVEQIGVRGDGIALHDGERIYLPLTAPGDVVRARLGARRADGRAGEMLAIETPGERQAARCPHFGQCGGCALQHLTDAAYDAAKLGWLAGALRQHGLDAAAIQPLRRLPPGTRRRARLTLSRPRRAEAPPELGFQARASHRVVDMRDCAVLHPALMALLVPLRRVAGLVLAPGEAGAATITRADTGIDLVLDLPAAPALAGLEALAAFAASCDLARLAWRVRDRDPAPVAQRRPVRVSFAGVAVDLPHDAFLQASAEADAALAAAVLAASAGATRIAELYAGLGTLTFALAARASVHAVEGDGAAVDALRSAATRAGLASRITTERRDLAQRPLAEGELARFDCVVFDPPRAGAFAQAKSLARSSVPRVVAASCNPATFARDARALADGGYTLVSVQPIDGFIWSPHLELVARFERPM